LASNATAARVFILNSTFAFEPLQERGVTSPVHIPTDHFLPMQEFSAWV
jgi:hypothetical protein